MFKASNIATVVLACTLLASSALAQSTPNRLADASDRAEAVAAQAVPSPTGPIGVQERGRQNDPRLVGTLPTPPVLVVGDADGFDVADAALGAALALAASLLAAGVLRMRRRTGRPEGALGV